jgi:hypothetical protein
VLQSGEESGHDVAEQGDHEVDAAGLALGQEG